MSADQGSIRSAATTLLDGDEVQCVLSGAFYTPESPVQRPVVVERAVKPAHYKVICISMYIEDLDHLDAMVDRLKARGLTKANRSALIRYALAQVDLDSVPRGL
jgi:hypothetical protein